MWRVRPAFAEVRALVRLPKSCVDLDQIRQDLSIANTVFYRNRHFGKMSESVLPTIEMWEEDERTICVPRHYEVPWKNGTPRVKDLRWGGVGKTRDVISRVTLRDDSQEGACNQLRKGTQDKIISLGCGRGKTVIALHAASLGKRFPVLVIVPTEALLDQWRKEILKCWDIKEEEIGHVQAGIAKWRGCPITIGMLHSLVLKKYPKEFYDYFRLIIPDELHRLGASHFSKACSLFPGERWGLTATVDREDKMDLIYRLHLGEVVFKDLDQPLTPVVYFTPTKISVNLDKFIFRGGNINTGRLYTYLAEHEERNALILKYLKWAVSRNRTTLVLGERLTQLYTFAEHLKAQQIDASVYVGAMGREEREEALQHQVVCATQHLAREGLDRPVFDTLFITTPFGGKGRLQQSIGRILRLHEGKKQPKVFIFVDDISIMSALARKMKRGLYSLGFDAIDLPRDELGSTVSDKKKPRGLSDTILSDM